MARQALDETLAESLSTAEKEADDWGLRPEQIAEAEASEQAMAEWGRLGGVS